MVTPKKAGSASITIKVTGNTANTAQKVIPITVKANTVHTHNYDYGTAYGVWIPQGKENLCRIRNLYGKCSCGVEDTTTAKSQEKDTTHNFNASGVCTDCGYSKTSTVKLTRVALIYKTPLVVGETANGSITYTPSNATGTVIVGFESSDRSVATVDSRGKVTAKAPGKTTITVGVRQNNGEIMSGSKMIEVVAKNATTVTTTRDANLRASKEKVELYVGDDAAVLFSRYGSGKFTMGGITNGSVATLNLTGNKLSIHGLKPGTATVKISIPADGEWKADSVTVTIIVKERTTSGGGGGNGGGGGEHQEPIALTVDVSAKYNGALVSELDKNATDNSYITRIDENNREIELSATPTDKVTMIEYKWNVDQNTTKIDGASGKITVPPTFDKGIPYMLTVTASAGSNASKTKEYIVVIPDNTPATTNEDSEIDVNASSNGKELKPYSDDSSPVYEMNVGDPIDLNGTPADKVTYMTYAWDDQPEQRINGANGRITVPNLTPGTHWLIVRGYIVGEAEPQIEKIYFINIPDNTTPETPVVEDNLTVDVIAQHEAVELAKPEENPTAVEKGAVINVDAEPVDKVTSIKYAWSTGDEGTINGSSGTITVPSNFEEGMAYVLSLTPYVGDREYTTKHYVIRILTDFQIEAMHNGTEIPDGYSGIGYVGDAISLYAQPADDVASIVYVWDNKTGEWTTVPGAMADITIPEEFKPGTTHILYAYAVGSNGKKCLVKTYTFIIPNPNNDERQLEVLPWEEENFELNNLAISLRNDSQSSKANKNMYALNEDVTYYIDFKNAGDDITSPVAITLNIPLDFEVVDNDGGTVDNSARTITWTYPEGMTKDYSGTKIVVLRYTAFSQSSYTSETIYPLATIGANGSVDDKSGVVNLIYKDSNTVLEILHKQYMHGDANATTFRPDDTITRAEGALVLGRILLGQDVIDSTQVSSVFPDIGETYLEAQKAITACTSYGIINGYTDGTYKPNRTMTRAEFMKILATFLEKDSANKGVEGLEIKDINRNIKAYNNPVTEYIVNGEVVTNHWAISQITLLARLNMTPVSAFETDLRIDKGIMRAEVAQLVNYYLLRAPANYDLNTYTGFSDVSVEHKLVGDIIEATRNDHHFSITSDATEIAE